MDSKKRSRWLILLCTLSCLSMRVFSEQCRPRDCGCTSAVEGLVVDLTRLDDHLIEQQIPRPTSNGVQYWISLCTPLSLSGNCSSNTLVCAVDQSDSSYTSYGREGSVRYSVQRASDSVTVCMTITGGDTSRRAHLMITCGALPSDSLESAVTSVVSANETDVEFSIQTTFDCVTPLDAGVPSPAPAPALAIAPLSNATTTTHSLSSLPSHTPTGSLPSITTSQASSSSTPQPTPVVTSSSVTTPLPSSSATMSPPSSSVTTPLPSSSVTMPSPSSSVSTPPPSSSATAPPPSSSVTTPLPSSSVSTPPPSSSATAPPPSSSVTTPLPSSSVTTPPSSSSVTTHPPSSSVTTHPSSSSATTHPNTTLLTFPSTHVHPLSTSTSPQPSSPSPLPQLSCDCESCTKNLALSLGLAIPGTAILTFLVTIFVFLCCKKARSKRQYIRLAPTVYFDDDEHD